jgi:hypothetical protein
LAKKTKKISKPVADVVAGNGANDKVCGWVTLITGLVVSGFLLWRNNGYMEFSEYNLLNIACILFVPLCVILFLLRRDLTEFGLTWGKSGIGLWVSVTAFLFFIPVIMFVAPQSGPQDYYLGWMGPSGGSRAISNIYWEGRAWSPGGAIDCGRLAYHEGVMAFYMFGWEWYHRGFLLNGLRKIMPVWGAVLLQALLFMALHWGKPWAETASSLPGGIVMGLLALRYQSFLPCFLLHFLISAGFDAGVLYYHFKH